MSREYTPPKSTNLPFNFSESGYSSPVNTSVLFNFAPRSGFGTLAAAVNVMQSTYVDATYTYTKTCPKYVVGYGPSAVQIIKGKCLFGGIRDIRFAITATSVSFVEANINASINSILRAGQIDIPSYCFAISPVDIIANIDTHLPQDVGGNILGIKKQGFADLLAFSEVHSPGDINSYIGVHQPGYIAAFIEGLKRRGENNLNGIVDTHIPEDLPAIIGVDYPRNVSAYVKVFRSGYKDISSILVGIRRQSLSDINSYIDVHNPSNIRSTLRSWASGNYNLPISLYSWDEANLNVGIGGHTWLDLSAKVLGSGKGIEDIPGYITGEKRRGYDDLQSLISTHSPRNLGLSITGVKKGDALLQAIVHGWITNTIGSIINVHTPATLGGDIRGWYSETKSISAAAKSWYRNYTKDFSSIITTHDPVELSSYIGLHTPGNLPTTIGIHNPRNLNIVLRGWFLNQQQNLLAIIKGWQQGNLSAYLGGALPSNLRAYIRGWRHEVAHDLVATLHSWQMSPNLNFEIGAHSPTRLNALVRGWIEEAYSNLHMSVHSWKTVDINAIIATHLYDNIKTSIRGWYVGAMYDVRAAVRVWQEKSVSAIIGTHMWSLLGARLFPHPPPPIYAIIRGWAVVQPRDISSTVYGWGASNLGAFSAGHQYKLFNIILKGIVTGAYKNLPSLIRGWQQSPDLFATIGGHNYNNFNVLLKGVVTGVYKNLPSLIHGWQYANLGVVTKGGHLPENITGYINIFRAGYKNLQALTYGWEEYNIASAITTHLPVTIRSTVRSWCSVYDTINALIRGWQTSYINVSIFMHSPVDLNGIIKVSEYTYRSIPSAIHGYEYRDLNFKLAGTHLPVDLLAQLQAKQRNFSSIIGSLRAWHVRDLNTVLNIVFPADLLSSILPIAPVSLSAYLNIIQRYSLPAILHGWQTYDLSASIDQVWDSFLYARIDGKTDTTKVIGARIKGFNSVYRDLVGYAIATYTSSLNAQIRSKYFSGLCSYLYAVAPVNMLGRIHAWDEVYFPAIISGMDYPWQLKAEIYPRGFFDSINAYINPLKRSEVFNNISSNIHSWQTKLLPANVYASSADAYLLNASLTADYRVSFLHATITPKMIRLTTIIKVATMNSKNLSAMINYACFNTNYSTLLASIYAKYKGDLYAYIRPITIISNSSMINAKTGYSDSYLEVDNFKLSISIYTSSVFVEDKIKLIFDIFGAASSLNSYIRGTLRYNNIQASIVCEKIVPYTFDSVIKNREKVVNKTYAGIFSSFEIVELAFKSAVKDYYYSSDGDYAWKKNRFDRWMLDVRSILPIDIASKLKRRLHKATVLYDLRKFSTIDEAVKFAIAYVTEYPQANLSAYISNVGTYRGIGGIINPLYVRTLKKSIGASITPIGSTIVINKKDSILKM